MSNVAKLAGRPKAPVAASKNTGFYTYPVLPARQKVWQVKGWRQFYDPNFGKDTLGFMRVGIKCVCLVEGADEANSASEAEQNVFRAKGHGMHLDLEVHPVISPPGFNKAKNTKLSASGLYTLISTVFYDGEEIPLADIGRLTPAELKSWMDENAAQVDAWVAEYRESLEEGEELPARAEIARLMLPASKMVGFLDRMVAEKVQVLAKPEVKTRTNDSRDGRFKAGDKYNRLSRVDERVSDRERLPDYRPFQKPADPREVNDNPLVLCSVTGEQIRGWENSKGEWVSNNDWADLQIEKLGDGPFTFDDVDGEFSPPFNSVYYRKAKALVGA